MNPRLIEAAEAAAAAAGVTLDQTALERFEVLRGWLVEEAIPAGGVGPNEAAVVEERHVADSILFAGAWRVPPSSCWDLGSGVGLPGLVLAIIWPGTRLVLVDSSQRRCDLARRGARVVGVSVEVRQSLIEDLAGPYEAIVSRATVPAQRFRPILARLLSPGGLAVISGSGNGSTEGFEPLHTSEFFDRDSRLLMMRSPCTDPPP